MESLATIKDKNSGTCKHINMSTVDFWKRAQPTTQQTTTDSPTNPTSAQGNLLVDFVYYTTNVDTHSTLLPDMYPISPLLVIHSPSTRFLSHSLPPIV